jgi:hypothetical protein
MSDIRLTKDNVISGLVAAFMVVFFCGVMIYACTTPKTGVLRSAWLVPAHDIEHDETYCTMWSKVGNVWACVIWGHRYWTEHVPDQCWINLYNAEADRDATWRISCQTLPEWQRQIGRIVTIA